MKPFIRNRVFLAVDLLGWTVIPFLALGLRLEGFGGVGVYLPQLFVFIVLAAGFKFASLWYFGIYRRYWRYASIDELILISAAVVLAGILSTLGYFALSWVGALAGQMLPRSVPIMDIPLTLLFVGGTRFSVRVAQRVRHRLHGKPAGKPVLIIGAGDAGTLIARELHANPQLKLEPIGFIDDDPLKQNHTILGLPILGSCADIQKVARGYSVRTAIIAMPTAPGRVIRKIRECCNESGITAKIIPGVYDIIAGRVTVNQLRDVQIEDLLRREPVQIDSEAVADMVRGTTVLVTGAGGSIGSEICRQAARFGATELILLGHGENSIFDIHSELVRSYPNVEVVPVIADVRSADRMNVIFEKHRPQVVFHAAAHKHVPLMELNPVEAVTNNVGGTLNVVSAAERAGVERFVLISTDKAVNATNIMGATKLLAEMLVHDAAVRTGGAFVSVRFGNVLASRGSVVPVFQRQIAAGGPVTVTHPKVKRYFMTIPEAVQLVFQASTLGKSGETFVLDMGDPVPIVQLARDLIQLSGLEVDKDIEIEFTGLRPGEKMSEELFLDCEAFERTVHEKIFVAVNGNQSRANGALVAGMLGGEESGHWAGALWGVVGEFDAWLRDWTGAAYERVNVKDGRGSEKHADRRRNVPLRALVEEMVEHVHDAARRGRMPAEPWVRVGQGKDAVNGPGTLAGGRVHATSRGEGHHG